MSGSKLTAEHIAKHLDKAREQPDGSWRACCPAHLGDDPNLSIRDTPKGPRWTCHSHHCDFNAIKSAFIKRGAYPASDSSPVKQEITAYRYTDANGTTLYEHVRYQPKSFSWRRPTADGPVYKLGDIPRVLYRLPDVIAAISAGERVWIVEGEKSADKLAEIFGECVTCSGDGAHGKWRPQYTATLTGADVIIWPDNDEQGFEYGKVIARNLIDVAKQVRVLSHEVLEVLELPPKGDAYDWVQTNPALDIDDVAEAADVVTQEQIGEDKIALPEPKNETRSVINLDDDELPRVTEEIKAALMAAGLPIYERGGKLVYPALSKVAVRDDKTAMAASFIEMAQPAMVHSMAVAASFRRRRKDDMVPVRPPPMLADIILARSGNLKFPQVAGVITCPTPRRDGSLITAEGYDEVTQLYHFVDESLELDAAVWKPTRCDAEAALAALRDLLHEFPFVTVDEAGEPSTVAETIALSAILSAVTRSAFDVVPLHGFSAPTAGTGKSFLVDTIAAIVSGRQCPVQFVTNKDEAEKKLNGSLLGGRSLISLDNLEAVVGDALLAQVATQSMLELRSLGKSPSTMIDNRVTLFLNGNNLRVRGDMTRRVLICRLDRGMERPEEYEFVGNSFEKVLANRGRFVSAALTIFGAYAAAGWPAKLRPLNGFNDWSRGVREALVWLGMDDPARSMDAARDDDPELAVLREVMALWANAYGENVGITIAEIVEQEGGGSTACRLLHATLGSHFSGRDGKIDPRRLGNWLASKRDKPVGMRSFRVFSKASGSVSRWGVSAPPRADAGTNVVPLGTVQPAKQLSSAELREKLFKRKHGEKTENE